MIILAIRMIILAIILAIRMIILCHIGLTKVWTCYCLYPGLTKVWTCNCLYPGLTKVWTCNFLYPGLAKVLKKINPGQTCLYLLIHYEINQLYSNWESQKTALILFWVTFC